MCILFFHAAQKISEYGKDLGIRITAAIDSTLPEFRKLSSNDQQSAVEKIEANLDVFASVVASGGNLSSPNTIAWMACQKLGYTPPSDFFSKLTDEDVIEIYSKDGLHQFANLKFFEICSYTLEQLYTLPWHTLWQREEKDVALLMSLPGIVLSPDHSGTLEVLSRHQKVKESASPFKYETRYQMRFIAPLICRDTHKKMGMIVSERALLEGPLLSPSEEEALLESFYQEQESVGFSADLTLV